jgi:hypothetical protein
MPDLLKIEQLSAGYGEAVVLSRISLSLAGGGFGAARPQRHGQDHADQHRIVSVTLLLRDHRA